MKLLRGSASMNHNKKDLSLKSQFPWMDKKILTIWYAINLVS